MGIVISVINNKGGCGKTTTTVNLAVALSRRGKKVLVVDLDSQCNSSACFKMGLGEDFIRKTLFDLLELTKDPGDMSDYIYDTAYDGVFLLPNLSVTAAQGPKIITTGSNSLSILKDRLRQYALDNYDYTIIDCPPNLEVFVIIGLIASDFAIVPTEAGSKFSLQGLIKAKDFIDDINRQFNPDLRFLRLLITKADSRTSICKTIIASIRRAFLKAHVFETVVPFNTDFQKAEAANMSIFKYRIGAPGAAAYLDVANEVIEIIEGSAQQEKHPTRKRKAARAQPEAALEETSAESAQQAAKEATS